MQFEKIIYISGMSCENCRKHVEDTLRALDGVDTVEVDLTSARARIGFSKDTLGDDQIRYAVENAGYQIVEH